MREATVSPFSAQAATYAALGGEILGQLAFDHTTLELGGQLRMGLAVGGEFPGPRRFQLGALGALAPGGLDLLRDDKRFVIPAQVLACGFDFVIAQRRAVTVMAAAQIGRTVADHSLAADQCGFVVDRTGLADRLGDCLGVMPVDVAHHMPAVGLEALRRVVGEPTLDMTVDRDPVVVVERDQLAETQRARE